MEMFTKLEAQDASPVAGCSGGLDGPLVRNASDRSEHKRTKFGVHAGDCKQFQPKLYDSSD